MDFCDETILAFLIVVLAKTPCAVMATFGTINQMRKFSHE